MDTIVESVNTNDGSIAAVHICLEISITDATDFQKTLPRTLFSLKYVTEETKAEILYLKKNILQLIMNIEKMEGKVLYEAEPCNIETKVIKLIPNMAETTKVKVVIKKIFLIKLYDIFDEKSDNESIFDNKSRSIINATIKTPPAARSLPLR